MACWGWNSLQRLFGKEDCGVREKSDNWRLDAIEETLGYLRNDGLVHHAMLAKIRDDLRGINYTRSDGSPMIDMSEDYLKDILTEIRGLRNDVRDLRAAIVHFGLGEDDDG